ncbi:MAG: nicotinate (nicotinamide) nucleotide adenylyltransferase [Solirubrobacterales bacterium]|nr:nicotinate (nicotinamide) nucleotide adenylyltransferase [Solirubrobacterales bacterium]
MVASNEGRVGVLGSAFNPPHVGHMLLAQEARWQLGLGRVLLMTTGRPPHKEIADDPGAELRLEMAATAAAEEEWLEASPLEVERDETSYSYRTLELLRKRDPEAELWFLLGADMAAGLESWERPERVLELARLAVVPRPGVEMDAVSSTLERLGAAARAEILEMPRCGVSSTMIRQRVSEGRPLGRLAPDGVVEMIERRGLYR